MANYADVVETVLHAYRSREISGTGGFSLSQQCGFGCSQLLSQTNGVRDSISAKCKAALEGIALDDIHHLLRETSEADLLDFLKALQYTYPSKTEEGAKCWLVLSKVCVLDISVTTGRKGREFMHFIVNQLDHLEGNSCVELVDIVLSSLGEKFDPNHTKCLELLPKLLTKISQMKLISPVESAKKTRMPSEVTGEEYKDHIISELCRMDWPPAAVVTLVTTLRDLQLSEEQLRHFLRKLARESKHLDLQELPPLVYQALLLSAQGLRQLFLKEILQLFNELDAQSQQNNLRGQGGEIVECAFTEEELVHVEGTVLHYFLFAVKQDPSLAQDLLKILKLRQCRLQPFEVALLLSLYTVQRYENKAFDILKKAVEYENSYELQRSISLWIDSIPELSGPSAMTSVMKSVLCRSGKGWEHIMSGFVGFALNLLTTSSKKSVMKVPNLDGSSHIGAVGIGTASASKGTARHMVGFSIQLLERAFRKHESVRSEILGQIFSSVITRDDSVPYFVQLLSKITRTCSRDVMDCLPKLKDVLEYIGLMTPNSAISLIRALEPILQVQSSLQDFFLIILRKSLMSREMDARLVALDCLLHIAQTSSASKAASLSQSRGRDIQALGFDSVAVEIISQVRRCMTQQVQLRQRLYDGLSELVKNKPSLVENVVTILWPQVIRYLDRDGNDIIKTLNLHDCIDDSSGAILEPIPHLLRSLILCIQVNKSERPGDQVTSDEHHDLHAAEKTMEKLASWLAASELEDFELDKSADFDKPGMLNLARLLIGVYEAFLEYILFVPGLALPIWLKRFLTIAENIGSLHEVLREHTKLSRGRKSSSFSAVEEKSTLLSCRFTAEILAISGEGSSSVTSFDRNVCSSIFENVSFMGMVLQTSSKQLLQMPSLIDNACSDGKSRVFKDLKAFVPLLFRQFYANIGSDRLYATSAATKKHSSQGKPLALLALNALEQALHMSSSSFSPDDLSQVAQALLEEIKRSSRERDAASDGQQAVPDSDKSQTQHGWQIIMNSCIEKLQQEFDKLEADGEGEQACQVLTVLHPILTALPIENRGEHLAWIQKKCKGFSDFLAASPVTARIFITTYLQMSSGESKLLTAKTMANDVRVQLGIAEEAQEKEALGQCQHKIVVEDTVTIVVSALSDFIKAWCDDVEWVLGFLDQVLRQDVPPEEEDVPEHIAAQRAYEQVEDSAITRLSHIFEVPRGKAECKRVYVRAAPPKQ